MKYVAMLYFETDARLAHVSRFDQNTYSSTRRAELERNITGGRASKPAPGMCATIMQCARAVCRSDHDICGGQGADEGRKYRRMSKSGWKYAPLLLL